MRCLAKLLQTGAMLALAAAATATEPASLAGDWIFDPARSTELSPWKSYDLRIAVKGDVVIFSRRLGWGRRQYADELRIDTAQAVTMAPIDWWVENRHLGAYVGSDHTRRIRSEWLDGRRILRLSTDLVLDAQQGPRAVNILSDYKLSLGGDLLTLTELRSTRNRPIVYVFTRAKGGRP